MQNNRNCKRHSGISEGKKYCFLCLAENPENLSDQKERSFLFFKWFQNVYEQEHAKKIGKLKEYIQKLSNLKNIINNEIDKSIDCIYEQVKKIGSQQQNQINDINFEKYITHMNQLLNTEQKQFKLKIEEQLAKIESRVFIDNLLKELWQLEDYQVQFNPDLLDQHNKEKIQLNIMCDEDDEQITYIDINKGKPRNKRLACASCITNDQYVTIDEAHRLWKQSELLKTQQLKNYRETTKYKIDQVILYFEQAKSSFSAIIDDAITFGIECLQSITVNALQYDIDKDWSKLSKKSIIDIAEQLGYQIEYENAIHENFRKWEEFVNQIIQDAVTQLQLTEQQCYSNIISGPFKDDQEILKVLSLQRQKNQTSNFKQINNNSKPANYQLLNYSTQQESCQCLCFNKEDNILAVGCHNDIKIFTFKRGQLQFLKQLQGHTGSIKQIYINQKSEIISCSSDKTIVFWVPQGQDWKLLQTLKEHSHEVICMVINKKEDILITAGCDKLIKSWVKNNDQWICNQTLENHSYWVVSLSLNDKEDKLLSCGQDKKLNIFIIDSNDCWSLFQTIQVEDFGYRASFTGDNIIAFQLQNKGLLQIYANTPLIPEFELKKEIEVKGSNGCWYLFPQIFCKTLSILVNKHNKFINIIRIQHGNIQVEQTIEFQSYDIYGTVSHDGQYLVVYNQKCKQIEIRKQF